MENVLVCTVVSSDFERTKYIVNTIVSQKDVKYGLLLLGKKENVSSFDELFEIVNYSKTCSVVKASFDEDECGEIYYLNKAKQYASRVGFTYVCFMRPGIAFYDDSSLYKMVASGLEEAVFKSLVIDGVLGTPSYNDESEKSHGIIWEKVTPTSKLFRRKKIEIGDYIGQWIRKGTYVDRNKNNGLIRMVFFVNQYSTWTSLQTLYEAALKNNRVDAQLVFVNTNHQNEDTSIKQKEITTFRNAGYDVISSSDYDIDAKHPEIAFYCIPYSIMEKGYNVDEVSKKVGKIVYIPYGPQLNTTWEDLLRLRYKTAMIYLAWKVFYEDEAVSSEARQYTHGDGKNIVTMGTPRMDIVSRLRKNSFPAYSKKVDMLSKGRKVVLWNTHHSINSETVSFSSWKQMGNELVDYISRKNDMFVLWRPHPYFREALKKYLGEEEYVSFFERIESLDNVFVDHEMSYLPAFSVSDIMLSDASTMAKEFLYMNKPVCITASSSDVVSNLKPYNPLYIYDDVKDVCGCLERLLLGNDELKDNRNEYLRTAMPISKMSMGERMLEYIISEFDKEENNK